MYWLRKSHDALQMGDILANMLLLNERYSCHVFAALQSEVAIAMSLKQ